MATVFNNNCEKSAMRVMEDKDLRQAFILFDVNRDGRITESELGSVLGFLGINATALEVRRMINDADIDGNGTVEFEEFLKMMKRYAQARDPPENHDDARKEREMMDAFKVFDHNNDSVIDFHEIKRTMHFLGEAVTDDEVREMIREADRDQDGLVSYEEFKYMMKMVRNRHKSLKRHAQRNRSTSAGPQRHSAVNQHQNRNIGTPQNSCP